MSRLLHLFKAPVPDHQYQVYRLYTDIIIYLHYRLLMLLESSLVLGVTHVSDTLYLH